jgi:hypothetical protein
MDVSSGAGSALQEVEATWYAAGGVVALELCPDLYPCRCAAAGLRITSSAAPLSLVWRIYSAGIDAMTAQRSLKAQSHLLGHRLNTKRIQDLVRTNAEAAAGNCPTRPNPHTLRHGWGTHALQGDADVQHVQKHFRNSSVQATAIYTRLDARLRGVADRRIRARRLGRSGARDSSSNTRLRC